MGLSMRPIKVSKRFEMDLRKKGKKSVCRCCGQFLMDGDDSYLIVLPSEIRKAFPKESNFWAHKQEIDARVAQHHDDDIALLTELFTSKRKRTTNDLVEDEERTARFREVLSARSLHITKESKDRIYFKTNSYSGGGVPFHYDKKFGTIACDSRARRGLFDSLFLTQFITTLLSELDPAVKVESAAEAIQQITATVDEMLK